MNAPQMLNVVWWYCFFIYIIRFECVSQASVILSPLLLLRAFCLSSNHKVEVKACLTRAESADVSPVDYREGIHSYLI